MSVLGAKVYDPTGTTLIATLSESRARTWLDQLNETGMGSVQIHALDPDLIAHPTLNQYFNIVRFQLDGTDRFAFVIENRDLSPAPPGEAADQWWTLSGRGVLCLLEDAVVYPEAPLSEASARDRPFGWMAATFDDSAWTAPVIIHATPFTWGGAGFGSPAAAGFPDPTANWIWGQADAGGCTPCQPPGTNYFRKSFTTSAPDVVEFFFTCDDVMRVWVDGELLHDDIATPQVDFPNVFKYGRDLPAGTHHVAVEVVNLYPVRAGLLFAAIPAHSGLLFHSDTSWKCSNYPATTPGQSAGEILRILIEEAQARGALGGVTLGFTDTLDSHGNAWADDIVINFQIGATLLDVARTLVEGYIDVDMSPTLVLNAYNKYTLGSDLTASVTLHVPPLGIHWRGDWSAAITYATNDGAWFAGVAYYAIAGSTNHQPDTHPADWVKADFQELSDKGDQHLANVVLTRNQTGMMEEVTDATSLGLRKRKETSIEYSTAPNAAAARTLATKLFKDFSVPTGQFSGKVVEAAGVYTVWNKGDEVTMPGLDGPADTTIISIAFDEDEAGHATTSVEAAHYN